MSQQLHSDSLARRLRANQFTQARDHGVQTAELRFERQDFRFAAERHVEAEQRLRWPTVTPQFTVNQFDYKPSPDFSLLAKYRYSTTESDQAATDARFEERSLGFAYRPVKSDRLNVGCFDKQPRQV